MAGDDAPVLIIGMTQAGRAIADALAFNDIGYLALEPDHERFENALADGYHVHRANPADPRSWDAIGMERREVLVIATGQVQASRELTPLVQERLPEVTRVIAVPGASEIEEFSALGMLPVDMSMSGGNERLIELVFAALDRERQQPVPGLAHDEPRVLAA
jgi:CPA2 family monovalent cation:H+ antiporter-2